MPSREELKQASDELAERARRNARRRRNTGTQRDLGHALSRPSNAKSTPALHARREPHLATRTPPGTTPALHVQSRRAGSAAPPAALLRPTIA